MLRAAIFDMDGLLIDSEPLWQQVEQAVFGELGLELTAADCQHTTGLRIDEVARHWFERRPWATPPTPPDVAARILAGVVELVSRKGVGKPGARRAIAAAGAAGLRLALASSSARVLIDATLERLGLAQTFEVIHSAETETQGKPHPAVYLSTAELLGLPPAECLAIEDSLNGVISAKAARMTCIAVPEVPAAERAPFAIADVLLDSLVELDAELFASLARSPATGTG